ncbi:hypothetical protein JX266_002519 [Neoarthrinium moseri]|nr:hypothetical protein JX266_002519 [Neoarthrinium moseri]
MEPLSALAFAGNILQFIEFAAGIISTSKEIYQSAEGVSKSYLEVENVYQKLADLSMRLQESGTANNRPRLVSRTEQELTSLAKSCKADCDRLLEAVQRLKVEEGKGRRWKSFRAALKTAWNGEQEIEELSARLRNKQQVLNLHVSAVTSEHLRRLTNDVQRLIDVNIKARGSHSERLDDISSTLSDVKDLIAASKDPRTPGTITSLDIENLSERFSNIAVSERSVAKEQAILDSLNIERRADRYHAIADAHIDTFQWIFDDSQKRHNGGKDFITWLKNSDGVFWIAGKPGSGKSTLMKFLADHELSCQAARQWAAPEDVIIASHYFWISGTQSQRSERGLLQDLLFDIFRQCPTLIEAACSSRWETHPSDLRIRQWTVAELRKTLSAMANLESVGKKFVFFVDGLDEHDGDHLDLCRMLLELAEPSSRVKICAASRPWNAFEESFGDQPGRRIDIHDLTHDDVVRYTQSRLAEHPRWGQISREFVETAPLVEKITSRAQGVFLWVKLVTQSLRDGMTNYDTPNDLQKRLESLPSDLESLYKVILDSVDQVYHQKMAETLKFALSRSAPTYWIILALHERSYHNQHYARHIARNDPIFDKSEMVKKQTLRHLSTVPSQHWNDITQRSLRHLNQMDIRIGNRIALRHLLRPCSENLEHTQRFLEDVFESEVFELLDDLQCFLADKPDHSGMCSVWETDVATREHGTGSGLLKPVDAGALAETCLSRFVELHRYSLHKLSQDPDYFRPLNIPALWYVLRNQTDHPNGHNKMALIHKLLDSGYDPNLSFPFHYMSYDAFCFSWGVSLGDTLLMKNNGDEIRHVTTPWLCYLESIGISFTLGPWRLPEKWLHLKSYEYSILWKFERRPSLEELHVLLEDALENGLFSTLLLRGADPNAQSSPFAVVWLNFVCLAFTKDDLKRLDVAYLRILDGFLDAGADLGATTIGFTRDPGSRTTRLPLCTITGWDLFCEHLELMSTLHPPPDITFISKVTKRMIKQAIAVKWPLGRLQTVLEVAFPQELRQPLLDLIGLTMSRISGKRNAEELDEVDVESKRLKALA